MTEKSAFLQEGDTAPQTRIQRAKRQQILEAGLTVFSEAGFRGATLDRIASEAGLSKPNLLYYYPSKEAIYEALLRDLLETWLDPLQAIDSNGEPVEEILAYVRRKLQMSRDFPRESRLFANEIVQGAPRIMPALEGELRDLVDTLATVIKGWIAAGRLAPVDPRHLLFSVWSLTQHYADFDVQVRAVLNDDDPFPGAETHLDLLFRRLLTP
ncbi:HTH-type transcriptional regulator RutR [Antarctobacter heliothermus]|uniref:HTH-type transcriptional regulator RutR n=1 Tax=Antarctobacter heliothermus TaxID=74033 RepID=A0A222DXQ2_9RHOB|nr:TetR family transcriptional regulator C-terminal domain-containing protein [Antarctobacter heliothermus]ASP18744.1 HTH-type transcriptional regulator RutR [Antarctobacter heliothermus]MBT54435.1 TetR family transcriptional regulator [Mameliella sp.]|tara:strand:- start:395 stop:1030 length:636 start_codon:yes stop_codon:yes gene_type:complete